MSNNYNNKILLKTVMNKFNVSINRIITFLKKKNIKINVNKNEKINEKIYKILEKEFKKNKKESYKHIKTKYKKLSGLVITGDKIDLSQFDNKNKFYNKKKFSNNNKINKISNKKRINKKIKKTFNNEKFNNEKFLKKRFFKKNVFKKNEIIKKFKFKPFKIKKFKKNENKIKKKFLKKYKKNKKIEIENKENNNKRKKIQILEFSTVNDLSKIINVNENKIILKCMDIGIMATLNQRLDAETITLILDEFNYDVEFLSIDYKKNEINKEEKYVKRPPIITVMGHVDHGKTSLLDYIRKTNLIDKEKGGITQHIGAYSVIFRKEKITFLDTPGHEAFTSMRYRGTKITDIVIIVIDTTDKIMPQTKEAIKHSQIANVPIIFALSKIDKENSNTERIKEELANMNLLVEDWGGKYQSQEISSKTGFGIDNLLEKIILESDVLELKSNSIGLANGTVIESSLDKRKGYITNIIVQKGLLKLGDYVLAGNYHGKIKLILDEWGNKKNKAEISDPVSIIGLNGCPNAGETFEVCINEKIAKKIAINRKKLIREQSIKYKKYLTLEEIGKRIALGNFKDFKIILKGDTDGSIEALSDSLQKLSNDSININIIYKNIGQITESDILLSIASNAMIIGFNVSANKNAIDLSKKENIEIRIYYIIYDLIIDIKNAIKGMLNNTNKRKEKILGSVKIKEIFNLKKIGKIAGCIVNEGIIKKNSKIKVIRDGIVIYNNGVLDSLKRFKENIKEVKKGYECGLSIKNYNNIKIGDIIESYINI